MLSKRFITQILLRGLFFHCMAVFCSNGEHLLFVQEFCLEPTWSLPKEMSDCEGRSCEIGSPRPRDGYRSGGLCVSKSIPRDAGQGCRTLPISLVTVTDQSKTFGRRHNQRLALPCPAIYQGHPGIPSLSCDASTAPVPRRHRGQGEPADGISTWDRTHFLP